MKLKSIYNTQLREPHPSMPCCSWGFKVVSLPSNLFSKVYISAAKKGTWQKRIQRTLLGKGVYTSLKGAINLIAKLCRERVKTWLASGFFFSCIIQKHVNILVQTAARGVCVWLCSQGSAFPAAGQDGLGPAAEQGAEDVHRHRLPGGCTAVGAVPRTLLRFHWQLTGSRIWPCTGADATHHSQNGICLRLRH